MPNITGTYFLFNFNPKLRSFGKWLNPFVGICEQFPLNVWMVFVAVIIGPLSSNHGPSPKEICNPSISLFVKDSKDRYRAVSKKLSNETKLFPGGR